MDGFAVAVAHAASGEPGHVGGKLFRVDDRIGALVEFDRALLGGGGGLVWGGQILTGTFPSLTGEACIAAEGGGQGVAVSVKGEGVEGQASAAASGKIALELVGAARARPAGDFEVFAVLIQVTRGAKVAIPGEREGGGQVHDIGLVEVSGASATEDVCEVAGEAFPEAVQTHVAEVKEIRGRSDTKLGLSLCGLGDRCHGRCREGGQGCADDDCLFHVLSSS